MVNPSHYSKANLDFQGVHPEEKLLMYFHQHWVRLVWPIKKVLVWNAVTLGAGYVTFFQLGIEDVLTRRFLLLFFTVSFLANHFEFLCRFYRYLLYIVVVTDKKIHRIKKTLIFVDDHQTIDLWMLQDINRLQHTLFQNLLGFGTIVLEAQETMLRLHFVPKVRQQYEKILNLREQARTKMTYYGSMKYGRREEELQKEKQAKVFQPKPREPLSV